MAPANTPNSTGYPGNLKFLGRCDCFMSIYPTIFETKMWRLFVGPPLASDLDQGAGEEVNARQVEPGGMEELWSEGSIFPA